jgi:hypothetical protein
MKGKGRFDPLWNGKGLVAITEKTEYLMKTLRMMVAFLKLSHVP